jgi:threonine/homoserine/homoserine lactone efflux protein
MGAFLLTCLLIELTPGPNMSWLAVMGAAQGRKSALAAVAGIALGLSIAGLIAGFGLAALINSQPWIFDSLRIAGSVYLLYLAFDAWRDAEEPPAANQTPARYFGQGLMTNILNPKAYLFYAAILPPFIDQSQPLAQQLLLLSISYVAVATLVHFTIALAAGSLAPWLTTSPNSRIIRKIMALAIAGVAIWFYFTTKAPL